jgi:hypothetical protein
MTHHIVVEHTIIQIRTLVTYMILQFVHCVSYFESDYFPNSINQLIVVMETVVFFAVRTELRGTKCFRGPAVSWAMLSLLKSFTLRKLIIILQVTESRVFFSSCVCCTRALIHCALLTWTLCHAKLSIPDCYFLFNYLLQHSADTGCEFESLSSVQSVLCQVYSEALLLGADPPPPCRLEKPADHGS